MPILKANAYGHGLVDVARKLEASVRPPCIGVAYLEEGIRLREHGIRTPVLVLGGILGSQIPRFLDHDLTLTASSVDKLRAVEEQASLRGRRATVHLKIDTGMERIGVHWYSADKLLEASLDCRHLRVEGIFTHLATADEPDRGHAERQLRCFRAVSRLLADHGLRPPLRHALNSAGTVAFPDSHYDLVRTGICVYGVPPAEMPGLPVLRPALSLKARVARLRQLPTGSCVGYGCTFVASRPTDVALVPVGYADGLSRSLSNCGWMLINGRRAPIIGRVSMDQSTIDVTGLGPVRQDDEVTLIGRQGEDEIDATEMADWRDTVAYEVLTGLSVRVPRVYMRGGQPVAVAENGEYRKLDAGGS
jgi:alanine racemase